MEEDLAEVEDAAVAVVEVVAEEVEVAVVLEEDVGAPADGMYNT